jgi:hypothetical protein
MLRQPIIPIMSDIETGNPDTNEDIQQRFLRIETAVNKIGEFVDVSRTGIFIHISGLMVRFGLDLMLLVVAYRVLR